MVLKLSEFFDYAIKHSAGGLSPRVKFKDLANYEFLLPPKDQQAKLAELLWALDEAVEKEKEALESILLMEAIVETIGWKLDYSSLELPNEKITLID